MNEVIQPGDFYLTRISGKTGIFITLAQWAIGDLSRYAHAGIYLGGGEVAEAMPGGLQINPVDKYKGKEFIHSSLDLTHDQRVRIVTMARDMEGIPYSYLGYLYVGLSHFKICPKWIKRKVSDSHHLFCSQAVDYIYTKAANYHMFTDNRVYLDVTPGDLARIIEEE